MITMTIKWKITIINRLMAKQLVRVNKIKIHSASCKIKKKISLINKRKIEQKIYFPP